MARIVFFGNERLATGISTTVPTLAALLAAGHEVCAVLVSHHSSGSRRERQLEIVEAATAHGIDILTPAKLTDALSVLQAYNADMGVLVAFGQIVPQTIIDLFPHGIINLHPSLLPRHRGSVPLESVILDSEDQTGVSVMQLVQQMDAGPIWAQIAVPLSDTVTKQQLADQLSTLGSQLVVEVVGQIMTDNAAPTPQDETAATTDRRLTKTDGRLDFTKPARVLEREVRAYADWPGSYTTLWGGDVTVTAAHCLDAAQEEDVAEAASTPTAVPGAVIATKRSLAFATTDGLLTVDRLKPAGKRDMTTAEFMAGQSHHLS